MNQTGGKTPSTPRLSEYATNALETIRKELRMFSISDVQNASNATNGQQIPTHQSKVECDLNLLLAKLLSSGLTEQEAIAFIKNSRNYDLESNKPVQLQQCNQRLPGNSRNEFISESNLCLIICVLFFFFSKSNLVSAPAQPPKLFRKPSIEREIPQFPRGSPALDSGAGSSRSNSTTDSATIYDAKPIEYCKQIEYCKPIEFCKHVPLQQCSNQRLPGTTAFISSFYVVVVVDFTFGLTDNKFFISCTISNSCSWYITGCAAKWSG